MLTIVIVISVAKLKPETMSNSTRKVGLSLYSATCDWENLG